jgi:hypothetical protein
MCLFESHEARAEMGGGFAGVFELLSEGELQA